MRRVLRLLSALAALALASGCSGIKVNSDFDPDIDFSGLRSYRWISQEPAVEGADPQTDNSLLDRRIRRAVDDTMATKGYVGVADGDAGEADFLVSYHIGVQQKLDVETIHTGYGYGYGRRGWYGGYGGPTTTRVDQYEEGTLLLDFVSPSDRQLIWRGSAQSRLRDIKTPEKREARVREVVGKILERFPPGK